jgi:SPP1 family predicted phage head-tail adaptor
LEQRVAEPWNIDAGELNQQIVIQAKVVTGTDSRGHPIRSYPALTGDPVAGTLVRCKVETLSGRKGEIAKELVPSATHMVTMRYRAGLNEETNRLVYKAGRVMNINQLNDVGERHVRLEILCTEQKTNATAT